MAADNEKEEEIEDEEVRFSWKRYLGIDVLFERYAENVARCGACSVFDVRARISCFSLVLLSRF